MSILEAAKAVDIATEVDKEPRRKRLRQILLETIKTGEQGGIESLMWLPPSQSVGNEVRSSIDTLLSSCEDNSQLNVVFFVMPVIFVVGGAGGGALSGVIREPDELRYFFEGKGILGHCKNFSLCPVLVDIDALKAIDLKNLLVVGEDLSQISASLKNFDPADIAVDPKREQAHLRFICGIAISGADSPSFIESAGNVGIWGIEFSQLLVNQFKLEGVTVLGIPRSPKALVSGIVEGYRCLREIALQLFLSNALKTSRLKTGEPDVDINLVDQQQIAIRLSSAFDDTFNQEFSLPVAPYESQSEILEFVCKFLEDVGLINYKLATGDSGTRVGKGMVQ